MKNVTLYVKKNWLRSLTGSRMLGNAKEDQARLGAGFTLEKAPKLNDKVKDSILQRAADEAVDNTREIATQLHPDKANKQDSSLKKTLPSKIK